MIALLPEFEPNSTPQVVQIDSATGALRYAFRTSPARISRSFKAAIVRAIHTLWRETTLAYVAAAGGSVT